MLTLNDGRSELWQWDTGRKLTVDADCSQVHFSNKVFGRSIDVDVADGMAIIPDILLQSDKELTAWAFVGTAENGYTKISRVFKVNKRNKPADYVFTQEEQIALRDVIKRLEDVEENQNPEAIAKIVNDYLEENPVESPVQSVNGKTGKVHLNAEDVGALPKTTKIPKEYVLPLATSDTLGGIKADPVESTDTQPVRIGADGKLYTAPGAPGGGVTPVSGGDLELIATVTTTEEVNVIEIDMDSNGKQFALKDIGINLDRTYTNPGSTGLFIESTCVNGRNYRLAYIPNMIKVTQYIRKFYSDSFAVSMFSSAADSVSEVVWTGYICPPNNNISKIKLNLSKTDISFPVGTKIELWGVRA